MSETRFADLAGSRKPCVRPAKDARSTAVWAVALAAAVALVVAVAAALLWPGAPVALAQEPLQPSPTYDPAQVTVPLAPPSARIGRSIYLENCAPCHGDTGMGDGPTTVDLNVPPAVFADASFMWDKMPAELFHTTKFGRMQRMMPPWLNELDDGSIWDAVWFAWSLQTSEAEVSAGQELYAASCARCHGDSGAGDGPDAEATLGSLSDQATLINASNNDWLLGWQSAHPQEGASWSVAEQTAAIQYMRTFGYVSPWESPWQAGNGAIVGSVLVGTKGGPSAAGLTAVVDAFLEFDRVATFTTTVEADATFNFTNLSTDPNLNYITSVLADGIAYSSDFITLSPGAPVAETTITVFGTTDDPTVLSVDRLHWIISSEPGAQLVGQIYAVGNTSDRTFVGVQRESAPEPVTFAMQLPPGAQDVAFENGVLGDRFYQVGPVIFDTLPVLPGVGTRQIVVRYVVPHDSSSVTLDQALLYPVADMSLLVADFEKLKVQATGLEFRSIQQMGERAYQFWEALDVAPQTVSVSLSGLPVAGEPGPFAGAAGAMGGAAAGATGGAMGGAAAGTASAATSPGGMQSTRTPPPEPWMAAVVAGVVAAALVGMLLWARSAGKLRQGHSRADLLTLRESLLDEAALLDDRHALGDVNESDWTRRRGQLKVQLVDVYARLDRGKQKVQA